MILLMVIRVLQGPPLQDYEDSYADDGYDDGDAEDDYAGDVCVYMGAEPKGCQALDRT